MTESAVLIPAGQTGWLVCAPGDPNELQWSAIYALAGAGDFCAEHWNYITSEVRCVIDYGTEGIRFVIDTLGVVRPTEVC